MSENKIVLSAYGSHNASIALYYNGDYKVVEVERWINQKNAGLTGYLPCKSPQVVFDDITEWLLKDVDGDVDIFITGYLSETIVPKFKYKTKHRVNHHEAHAAAAFYQSPFTESTVISFDGGGDGDYFCVYKATRTDGIQLVDRLNYDLGFPYMILAHYMFDIKKEPLNIGNLVYAGKLMGLCSYGSVREEWLPHFINFYKKFKYNGDSFIGGLEVSKTAVPELFKSIGVEFNENIRYKDRLAWDIAATTQRAFEEVFLELAGKYLVNGNVCMSGGCGLNVLLNSRIMNEVNKNIFIPPNTNDCGIAVGSILHTIKPQQQVDLTYSGTPILDDTDVSMLLNKNNLEVVDAVQIAELAQFLYHNFIVGVIQGNSEHGSRALGNRSIICNPTGDMKNVLNMKVKHREWYRPFAPIVPLEDVNKYFHFENGTESRHMTFVAKVRDEWKNVLPAITHEDGTGRLQTVTEQQNPFIYRLLKEFEKVSGYAVLLNTSFNDNGKPILTRLSDAFSLLNDTELDAIYYKNSIIMKESQVKNFKNVRQPEIKDNIMPTTSETNPILFLFDHNKVEKLAEYDKEAKGKYHLVASKAVIDSLATSSTLNTLGNMNGYEIIGENRLYMDWHVNVGTVEGLSNRNMLLWLKECIRDKPDMKAVLPVVFVDMLDDEKVSTIVQTLNKKTKKLWSNEIVAEKYPLSESLFNKQQFVLQTKNGPSIKYFAASIESLIEFSNAYEAVLMSHGQTKPSLNAADYMPMLEMKNNTTFKLV